VSSVFPDPLPAGSDPEYEGASRWPCNHCPSSQTSNPQPQPQPPYQLNPSPLSHPTSSSPPPSVTLPAQAPPPTATIPSESSLLSPRTSSSPPFPSLQTPPLPFSSFKYQPLGPSSASNLSPSPQPHPQHQMARSETPLVALALGLALALAASGEWQPIPAPAMAPSRRRPETGRTGGFKNIVTNFKGDEAACNIAVRRHGASALLWIDWYTSSLVLTRVLEGIDRTRKKWAS